MLKTSSIGIGYAKKQLDLHSKQYNIKNFENTETNTENDKNEEEKKEATTAVFLRPVILGAIDGLVTSFVIIAGGFAGNIEKKNIVIIGFASLFADAFSMGTSELLSVRNIVGLKKSIISGFLCLISFAVCGSLPLISYILVNDINVQIALCIVVFEVVLICVAVVKSFATYGNKYKKYASNILEITFLGSLTGAISASIAYVLKD